MQTENDSFHVKLLFSILVPNRILVSQPNDLD